DAPKAKKPLQGSLKRLSSRPPLLREPAPLLRSGLPGPPLDVEAVVVERTPIVHDGLLATRLTGLRVGAHGLWSLRRTYSRSGGEGLSRPAPATWNNPRPHGVVNI